jgi:peptidoglycan/LPS O-acetylase OafA/YrhL
VPPRSGVQRFASLDHWRGLACLLVIVYHSTIVYLESASHIDASGALHAVLTFTHRFNVGVALFFVISGYCIAAAADNSRRRNDSIRTYFIRRFRRIYPPYWIVVLVSIGAFFAVDYGWRAPLLSSDPWPQYRPSWYSTSQWIGNLTLIETWRYHVFGTIRGHFPGQAWTLCYEEQFYFVTGMVLLSSRKWFFPGIAAVSIATLLGTPWARAADVPIDGFFFDGSWLLFAAGVAVFYRIRYATGLRARALDAILLAGIPLGLSLQVPIYGAVIGFAFAAALPWLYTFDRQIASAAVLQPLLVCGQMCYSLYLVHQIPVKAITTAFFRNGVDGPVSTLLIVIPVSVVVAVGLGWIFHVTVERRFLNTPLSKLRPTLDVPLVDATAAVGLPARAEML